MLKITKIITGLLMFLTFTSCSDDDAIIDNNQDLKSYELVDIQWRLTETDGQRIIEEQIPEFSFENNSDTVMEIVIEPLKDLKGFSIFKFEDSEAFSVINYEEIKVSIPEEISFLSEGYSNLIGGIKVPLTNEKSSFPFSTTVKNSTNLQPNSKLTSNYTVFLRENKASFLATFKEMNTGEILKLNGGWTGLFFNNLEVETVTNPID
ncbi:hypothetical protein [Nonlabens agnitus]|uniref:DUF4843 domain-containing protein n=1 Tax=Nonlabens agnitus TaxID=870484 RepID=A0A2S9WVH3_9FLAO|nr:hypothetical protein [Nonlabens agnitus]PRP67463.1 hypothetical protein BST86_10345 [Nonlabens agnitus]